MEPGEAVHRWKQPSKTKTAFMPLSHALDDAILKYACPHCGDVFAKQGRWFMRASTLKCGSCSSAFRIGYEEKLKLFAAYARRLKPAQDHPPGVQMTRLFSP
jgi:hypothetical protein